MSQVTYDELSSFTFSGAPVNPDPTPEVTDPLDFVDRVIVSPNGVDALGFGVDHAPYRTINFALDQTPGDIVVVLEHGTYTEMPIIEAGRRVRIIGRAGIPKIDGEGARSCAGVAPASGETPGGTLILENVHLARPPVNGYLIQPQIGRGANGAGVSDGSLTLVNCVGYSTEGTTTGRLAYARNTNSFTLDLRGCTFKNLVQLFDDGSAGFGGGNVDLSFIASGVIADVTSFGHPFCSTSHEGVNINLVASAHTGMDVRACAYRDATAYQIDAIDLLVQPAPYKHAAFDVDFDLSLDETDGDYATYNTGGEHESLVGATFYAFIGHNVHAGANRFGYGLASAASWKDAASLGGWISDPDYPDGGTKGEAIRIELEDFSEEALILGDGFQIESGKDSARLLSPVVKLKVIDGQADLSVFSVRYQFDGAMTVTAFYRFADDFQPFAQDTPDIDLPFIECDNGQPTGAVAVTREAYAQLALLLEI